MSTGAAGLEFLATIDDRGLDAEFSLRQGSTLALVGPNGAGKTTVVQVLAGLLRPDTGRIVCNGTTWMDISRDRSRRRWLPAHRRGVGLLAQEPLLFPHLSALDNIAFGPRSRGAGRSAARSQAGNWMARLHLEDLATRKPEQLSAGQSQQVALCRALASDPTLLVLDEPLASVDVASAAALRQTLQDVTAGRTVVLVTHDVIDAVLLADQIVVLEHGTIIDSGSSEQVLRRPRTAFAADFAGLNLLRGVATGPDRIEVAGWQLYGQVDQPLRPGEPAAAVFAPTAVAVFRQVPEGSPRNVMSAVISDISAQSNLLRITAGGVHADITAESGARLQLGIGVDVQLAVKSAQVQLYPSGR